MDILPRIAAVAARSPSTVTVAWRDGSSDRIDLTGWIETGGEVLAPLKLGPTFEAAMVGDHGASVAWDDDDLAIDAVHLKKLADEQRPFGAAELVVWQRDLGLSNHEAAAFLGVALSTWNAYKAGATIPPVVAMVCRAATRDPILVQAHYKPRRPAGRPRKGPARGRVERA